MKKYLPIYLLVLVLSSCTQPEELVPVETTAERLGNLDYLITENTWKVSFFWEAGNVITEEFRGFRFKFYPDGTFTAFHDQRLLSGYWETGENEAGLFMHIKLLASGNLAAMAREWAFQADPLQNHNSLRLQDLAASKADSYFLYFTNF